MIVVLIIAFCIGLSFGSTKIDIGELIDAIRTNQKGLVVYRVFLYVRLPRVLAAMFAGAALAVSGVIIQGVLHNPLAGPNIIGVNSGAGFGAICAMIIFPYKVGSVPVMAFLGALITSLLVYLIALKSKSGKVTIVLAGVAISSILSAGIDALKTVFPDVIIDSNSFMIGGFSGISIKSLFPAVYYIIFGLLLAMLMARNIDILGLGEEMAQTLGMNVKLNRFLLIICSSMLAGAAVSFCGLLGFVGLIVPHIVRKYTGNNHKLLIPCSALMGASFVIICDLISRVLFVPYEIPVGIVMSFIGGPFFIILLLKGVKYNQ
ncbi:MAG: iron ABC transporter permease [Lachnospiraceae bacterium]|nr:iron ABC transporter permease [Lachnospiraceae bacterium]